ncbi:hypothetical protein [Asanoa iriomotensis]|uniref:Leucine rich repeat (LRR) protein n=1 Tax=Asanoa iriomotensis TaxID=234613 RepID=A0ABQ4BZA0_9ACTN|nr:hypothetical protein [Asanoa iriomotensis]GIF55837.1 hypothetical protein Air01nite_19320 [Asanoa iriomotensis]
MTDTLDAALDGLAENPALPTELVRRLIVHRGGPHAVAKRADLTDDLFDEILASDHRWLAHSLALSRHLPPHVSLRLVAHTDAGVRAALAAGQRVAPRDVFARLVDDPDKRAREHLAQNGNVPDDLRARLARDPEPSVRALLARWWVGAPEEVRRMLLTDPVDEVRGAAGTPTTRTCPTRSHRRTCIRGWSTIP